jgi:hypothetical protein
MNHSLRFSECQIRALEIMEKMNLEVEDHDNGTLMGFGDISTVSVNCHQLDDKVYIQLAVASQKQEIGDLIMNHIVAYLRNRPGDSSSTSTDPNSHYGKK